MTIALRGEMMPIQLVKCRYCGRVEMRNERIADTISDQLGGEKRGCGVPYRRPLLRTGPLTESWSWNSKTHGPCGGK